MAQDDKTQRWSMVALIAFNVTVILCMIIYIMARGGMGGLFFGDFFVALVLGAVVACVAFIAAMKLDL
jgi:hypothetical protein